MSRSFVQFGTRRIDARCKRLGLARCLCKAYPAASGGPRTFAGRHGGLDYASAKQASKRKRRKEAVPALGVVGVSLSLAGGASAATAGAGNGHAVARTPRRVPDSRSARRRSPTSAWRRSMSSTRKTPEHRSSAYNCPGCGRGCGGCRRLQRLQRLRQRLRRLRRLRRAAAAAAAACRGEFAASARLERVPIASWQTHGVMTR